MKHLTPIYLLFLSLIVTIQKADSRVRDYETTRLKSTAGAGVGSILINESAILNPAPLAFYKNSSFYFQRGGVEYSSGEEGAGGEEVDPSLSDTSESLGIIVADTKKNLRGSVSYQKQREGIYKRRRMTLSLASTVSPNSSLGFLYRNTKDEMEGRETFEDGEQEDTYHQLVIGATHVISERLTFGTVIVDPFRVKPQDARLVMGGQYTLKNILTFIADVGGNYQGDLLSSRLFRGAIQLNFVKGLFLRMGFFEDWGLDERGTGIGAAWVGPRLVLEASMKTTRDIGSKENKTITPYSQSRETSFALSYFF